MTQQVDREAALAEARARGDKAKKLLMEAIINIREAMHWERNPTVTTL